MFNTIKLSLILKRIRISGLVILSLLIIFSCYRDPINIDLSEFENNIVIEGSITNRSGPHSVRISRTGKYQVENEFPAVSGATVTINDNLGNLVDLQETNLGEYRTYSLLGVPGRTYTLTVIADGEKYTASSTMIQPLELQAINFTRVSPTVNSYELSCSFQDRPDIEDYCLIKVYSNGELNQEYLYQDKLTDGEEIVIDDFYYNYSIENVVTVELLTFDEESYRFFKSLDTIDERDEEDDEFESTFIPVTTYNPTTNLNNGALGYFGAYTVMRYVRMVY